MFTYRGPRKAKVGGLWDEQLLELAFQDLMKDVHVLVGTPAYLSQLAETGTLSLHNVRALVLDEVCSRSSDIKGDQCEPPQRARARCRGTSDIDRDQARSA